MTGSSLAIAVPPPGRTLALGCLMVAAVGLGGNLVLAGTPTGALSLVPSAAGILSLIAGSLCLVFGAPAATSAASPDASAALIPGLQVIFRDLNSLLMDERDRLATFQEVFTSSTQEALSVNIRLSRLVTAAADAETRLIAGVAQAEQALEQPLAVVTWVAEAAQRIERAVPELAEVIQRGVVDQARTTTAALAAAADRLSSEADGPVRAFRDAVTLATDQITALGGTAASLREDAASLDTAGREIATATANVVARLGDAAGRFDATLATLPTIATQVTRAAEQAAGAVSEAGITLAAEGAALEICNREALQVLQAVRTAGQDIADRLDHAGQRLDTSGEQLRQTSSAMVSLASEAKSHIDEAFARLPSAAAEVLSAADQAAQSLTEAGSALRSDAAALDAASRDSQQSAETLRLAGQQIGAASASAMSQAGQVIVRVDAALARLPELTVGIATAADQAARTLNEAAAVLCADSAALDASARETLQTAEMLRSTGQDVVECLQIADRDMRQAGGLLVSEANAATARVDAAFNQFPDVASAMTDAVDQAARTLADAASALRGDASILTATLADGSNDSRHAATALHAAGQDMAAASAAAIAHAGQAIAHVDIALGRLPAVSSELAEAANQATRTLLDSAARICAERAAEHAMIDAGCQSIGTVTRSAEAVTARLVAALVDTDNAWRSTAELIERCPALAATLEDRGISLDAAGRRLAEAGNGVAERLSAIAAGSEAALRGLPDVALETTAAVAGLRLETSALTAAMLQITAAGTHAAAAMAGVLDGSQQSVATIAAVARTVGTATDAAEIQIGRLALVVAKVDAQVASLPNASAQLAAATDRLVALADIASAAAPVEPEHSLADLAADMTGSLHRVEAALAHQDDAWPAVIAIMAEVQDVMAEVRSAVDKRPAVTVVAESDSLLLGAANPAASATTAALGKALEQLDGVSSRTEVLLRQTESLAEAVMQGKAPGLPVLLADRAPALLAGVETTIRRLRSVSTALAMASDGPLKPLQHAMV